MDEKYENRYLGTLFFVLLLVFFVLKMGAEIEPDRDYKEKIAAAKRMDRAITELGIEGKIRGINREGYNESQRNPLYGLDFSEITTTLGSKESKQTSINPNFSAVVVEMLMELEVQQGEMVAVNFSSSFPAINIAVLCALDTLGIESVVITSMGASTYGGNNPEFSYLDMEKFLYEREIIGKVSDRISYGGRNDLGEDITIESLEAITARIGGEHKLIKNSSFNKNLQEKIETYSSQDIKAFINVGGNLTALGKNNIMYEPGIIKKTRYRDKTSLISHYLNKNIPVIHFLNIKEIANEYNLPIAPRSIDEVGNGQMYITVKYSVPMLIIGLILGVLGVLGYGVIGKKNKA